MPFFLPGSTIADHEDEVSAFGPSTVAAAAPKYISLKNADAVEVVIRGLNASGVTGSAVTLLQAKSTAGANSKALAFSVHYKNEDAQNTSANTGMTRVNTASNTFTTVNTNSVAFVYRIPVRPAMLDVEGGFTHLGIGLANATNTTVQAGYRVFQKNSGAATNNPSLY